LCGAAVAGALAGADGRDVGPAGGFPVTGG
jgi:hypothetical protein